jgi:hypothetical protein
VDQRLAGRQRDADDPGGGHRLDVRGEHAEVVGVADRGDRHPRLADPVEQRLDGSSGRGRAEAAVAVDDEDGGRGPRAGRPGRGAHGAVAQPLGEHVEAAEAVGGMPAQVALEQQLRLFARVPLRHSEAGEDVRGEGQVLLDRDLEQVGHGRSTAA